MTLFFGAGLASAVTKLRADARGDLGAIVFAQQQIVWADWLFTVPSGILLPVTGFWMAHDAGWPMTSGWVLWGAVLYAVAGVCWVPAAVLQIRMRDAAVAALAGGTALPPAYRRHSRIWLALGLPAFAASLLVVFLMVGKQQALGLFVRP